VKLSIIERYLARQIYAAVGFGLLGFLCLFAFFDLVGELSYLGRGDYRLPQMASFVLLSAPAHAYELLPVVVLIGVLYVVANLASNSEFTVMRGAGLSPRRAAIMLMRIGVVFVAATFIVGEWGAPLAEQTAQKLRMRALHGLIGVDLRTGLWFKDERAFINVREARQASALTGMRIYEFDTAQRLFQVSAAEHAEYRGGGLWALSDVVQTRFTAAGPRTAEHALAEWRSSVTPEMLEVLIVVPDQMSILGLAQYIRHLTSNKQKTERYEIAMWKKIFYPFAILVMMALALPFAYVQARSGMVGLKVFLGIMLGILFHLLNGLFAHIGLLRDWPPVATAALPSAMFLFGAAAMMWWVERR
jgi:lipopolysaccharide export system permease protein